ncbi:MAG: toll/interleukin-1 receptor domain-containing protein, partial [Bacilli bacterium]|nr:toll/interleukin-1 receptor domain-containing protein [Bacilli bacterium]
LKKSGVIFISFKYKDINEETIKPYLRVSGFNILDSIITDEWFNVVLKKVAKPTYEVRNDQREIVCRRRMSRRTNKVKQTRSNLEYALITGNCLPTIRRSDRDVGLHKFGPYNPNPSDPDYRPPASINFLLTSEQKIIKDSNFVLDFYLFTDEYKSTIDKMVNASLSTPVKEGVVDGIKNDCNISILLSSPDIPSINDEDTYKWSGTFHTSNLCGYVPKDYDRDSFIVVIDIVVDGVRISRIKSNININDNNPGQLIFNRNDVKRVFFSYSRKDIATVYTIVGRIRRAFNNDIDFFLDVMSLRAGDNWEQRLYKEIDDRDTFCLIWSKHACKSEWVDREWRYALEHKGLSAFSPINLDSNNKKVPIPHELESIHFACYPMIFK